MEKKDKKDGYNLRISTEAYKALKAHCDAKGLKLGIFLSNVILERTKIDLPEKSDQS